MAVKQLKMQAQSEEAMEGEGDEATPFAEFRKEVAAMRYGTYNTPATSHHPWILEISVDIHVCAP